ncbi:MAG TPA: zinc-ribbon domain-containing protein [Jatrophihabitantaceae bacterium]
MLLEWSGQQVETPAPPPPLAGPLAASAATAGPDAAAGTQVAGGAPAAASLPPAPMPPPLPPAGAPAPPNGLQPDQEAMRPAPVPMTPADQYGGLFCSVCGTRNADGRTFCRYCGHPLDLTVPVGSRRRWWQRLFRRKKSGPAAGDRPRGFRRKEAGRRRKRRFFSVPLAKAAPILMVLSLVGIGLGPARSWISQHASSLLGTAKKKVSGHYVPVVPLSASASTSATGHGPKLGIDGIKDTWWQSRGHPDGVGETMTVRFATPTDIDQIGLLAGPNGDKFRTQGRPRTMEITTDGKPSGRVAFDDKADFQTKKVHLRNVTSITLVITAAYQGQGKGKAVAIREVQFSAFQTS